MEAIMTADGQVTLPQEVLDHLNVKPGDNVEFRVEPDGRIVLVKATGQHHGSVSDEG